MLAPPGQGLPLFKEISLATFPALKPKLAAKTNTCKWPRLGFLKALQPVKVIRGFSASRGSSLQRLFQEVLLC